MIVEQDDAVLEKYFEVRAGLTRVGRRRVGLGTCHLARGETRVRRVNLCSVPVGMVKREHGVHLGQFSEEGNVRVT